MSPDRVALVTGGSRGIGRAISLALAADGAAVAVNFRRDEAAAQRTVDEINSGGGTGIAWRASVENYDEDERMVEGVTAQLGPIDILVSNAGSAGTGRLAAETPPAEVEHVVRVHAFAAHVLAGLVLPSMRAKRSGDIVMISSAVVRNPEPNGVPYAMAKAAQAALVGVLAKEERRYGIRANVVAPGLVDTDLASRFIKDLPGIESISELGPVLPFGRACSPSDIAEVVRFLTSEGAAYITGQVIFVDGGLSRDGSISERVGQLARQVRSRTSLGESGAHGRR